jgi:hypothetical protein
MIHLRYGKRSSPSPRLPYYGAELYNSRLTAKARFMTEEQLTAMHLAKEAALDVIRQYHAEA